MKKDALSWIPNGRATQTCIEHDGLQRCWYMFIPDLVASSGTPASTIVHLHGAGGCASLPATGLGNIALEEGIVMVWPQGLAFANPFIPDVIPDFVLKLIGLVGPSWNDGSGLFGAEANGVDDMGFLQKLVQEISKNSLVDTSQLYFSGHSNGATMAQRFALQTENAVSAVIAISGAGMPNDDLWEGSAAIEEYRPTPIILVSGTSDQVVPFSERRGPLSGAIPSLNGWADINGCTGNASVTLFAEYASHQYNNCSNGAQVQLLEVYDAGHHPFSKGEEPFLLSTKNVIADCPFRKFPFFHESDCRLQDLDSTRLAWEAVSVL